MKLLNRQELDTSKASDKRREIDEGIKLAKKVDKLRELSQQEEANLKRFRDNSLRVIHIEIANAIKEKEAEQARAQEAKEARILAEAPLDLKKAWLEVENQRKENVEWKTDLLNRESSVIVRESTVESKTQELVGREEGVQEQETLSKRYIAETKKAYDDAEFLKSNTEAHTRESEKVITSRIRELDQREADLNLRENDLALAAEGNRKQLAQIADERLHIESQQQTLKTAWEHIRKLKAKNG